jgi:hypothetical protein
VDPGECGYVRASVGLVSRRTQGSAVEQEADGRQDAEMQAMRSPQVPVPRGSRRAYDPLRSPLITPFNIIPMTLARSGGGRIAWNLGLFVLVPLVIWSYWVFYNWTHALPPSYEPLRIALPLGGLMGALNPVLFSSAERALVRWMSQLETDKAFGWNAARARAKVKAVNRWYYPFCLMGVAAAVVIVTFAEPHITPYASLPVPDPWTLVALYFVASLAGFSAISDLHLVVRWLVAVNAAVTRTDLNWKPFPPPRYPSLTEAYRISLMIAFYFSLGALWIPLLFIIKTDLGPIGSGLVWVFIALLTIGGLLAFTAPFVSIIAALLRSKRRYRDAIDAPIGKALDMFTKQSPDEDSAAEFGDRIIKILEIRNTVASVRVFPIVGILSRAILTVVVPIASLALSLWQTAGFS